MIMRLIQWLIPQCPETDCNKCDNKSFCNEGIPNCAVFTPQRKAVKPVRILMSFNPTLKKFSRPVFDNGRHPSGWEWAVAMFMLIALIALVATADASKEYSTIKAPMCRVAK